MNQIILSEIINTIFLIAQNLFIFFKGNEPLAEGFTCLMSFDEENAYQTRTRRNDAYADMAEQESNQHGWINVVVAISNCLMIVNSSINFYIYFGKYRKHLPKHTWTLYHVFQRNISHTQPTAASTRLSMIPSMKYTRTESKYEKRSSHINFD